MRTVDISTAKKHLSRLVEQAAKGKPFIIAKAGKPLVKVVALDAPTGKQVRRVGFLKGQFSVPDDFDEMGKRRDREALRGSRMNLRNPIRHCCRAAILCRRSATRNPALPTWDLRPRLSLCCRSAARS